MEDKETSMQCQLITNNCTKNDGIRNHHLAIIIIIIMDTKLVGKSFAVNRNMYIV